MRRPVDIVMVKALVRAHTISASEAAAAAVNTGAGVSARRTMVVMDLGAVTGSINPTGVDGSDDNSTYTGANIAVLVVGTAFGSVISAAGGHFYDVPQFRYYKFLATTIVTGPIIYGVYLVALSAATPITQAI